MDGVKILFAWGGCGNLFQRCLLSNSNYEQIIDSYDSMLLDNTWTNQEWTLRNQLMPENLIHDVKVGDPLLLDPTNVKLAWSDSKYTAFHYCIKNITMNHLSGDFIERFNTVLRRTHWCELEIRKHDHVIVDRMLADFEYFMERLQQINPLVQESRVAHILSTWRKKTSLFYHANALQVLDWFHRTGLDIDTQILHNLIYENTNTR